MSHKQKIMIIGAGALASEVHSVFHNLYDIVGFLDKPKTPKETINGCRVYSEPTRDSRVKYVIAVGHTGMKELWHKKYTHLPYTSLVHPTAIVSDYTSIKIGDIVFPYAVIDPNVTLGEHVFIGYHAFIGHHSNIGNYSTIFSYAAISGYTQLAEKCYIGTHAVTVNERYREHCLHLGIDARVGAGAVVTKDVKNGEIVIGVPAKS